MDFIRYSVYPEVTLKSQNYSTRPVILMSYIKSTKTNYQRRTERREVHSRPTGSESVKILKDVSESETPKDPSKD